MLLSFPHLLPEVYLAGGLLSSPTLGWTALPLSWVQSSWELVGVGGDELTWDGEKKKENVIYVKFSESLPLI